MAKKMDRVLRITRIERVTVCTGVSQVSTDLQSCLHRSENRVLWRSPN